MNSIPDKKTDSKRFLQRGMSLEKEIIQLKLERQHAFALACGTSSPMTPDKVQASHGNTQEQKLVALADYTAEIDKRINQLQDYRKEMLELITLIDDSLCRTLLIARYLRCLTWESIAVEMNYCDRWIRGGLHSKALIEFNKVYSARRK